MPVPLLLTQAEHAGCLRELQLRAEVAELLVERRDVEMQAANEQLRAQAAQIAVSAWEVRCMPGWVGVRGFGCCLSYACVSPTA